MTYIVRQVHRVVTTSYTSPSSKAKVRFFSPLLRPPVARSSKFRPGDSLSPDPPIGPPHPLPDSDPPTPAPPPSQRAPTHHLYPLLFVPPEFVPKCNEQEDDDEQEEELEGVC